MRELFAKLFRRQAQGDLDSEILSHIELRMDDNIAAGMTPAEARAEARRHFGNVLLTRERAREAWRFPRIESFVQDLRYGLRSVGRSPGFAFAIIFTLALGIGATTAIFSVVYNILLRPLPYPGGERLVGLGEVAGKADGISVTWINYLHWRGENRSFEEMAAMEQADFTMTGRGEAQIAHGAMVTPSFFNLTSSQAQIGRLFTEADDRAGAPGVAVLTWEFWNKAFGADPAALDATLALNGKPYRIIGVLRPAVRVLLSRADYYVPLGPVASLKTSRAAHGSIGVLGLLKPGVTLAIARANLNEIMQRLALSDPGPEASHRASAVFVTQSIVGDLRQTLLTLMAAVALLLLIACANVSSLLLVRGAARTREIAIRTSIGAGRARVARQLLTENLALSVFGGAIGVLFAFGCLRALIALAPKSLPRVSEMALDLPVLAFAAAVTMITAALAGVAPVFAAGRVDVASALKDGGAGSGASVRGQRLRGALVVGEIAVTLLLSFASAGLIRSLIEAQHADPGFDARNLLALGLQLSPAEYKTRDQVRRFHATLTDALRREPGVLDVAIVTCPPGAGDCGDYWYSPLDRPSPARPDVPVTLFLAADTSYFRMMGIRLLAGRAFGPDDRAGSPPVTIVNEELVHHWWPNPEAAIGRRIKFGGPYNEGDVMEIVGVAANVSQMGLDGEKEPQMFFPLMQDGPAFLNLASIMMRVKGNPAALIPAVRHTVSSLNPNLPIRSLQPFDEQLGATLARRRFSTLLLGVFAALAMVLAGVGIYGMLNYWVQLRNREIAVRMALGVRSPTILGWAGWQALRLALAGISLGAVGGWSTARLLKSMVYGVSERSPVTMLIAIVVVLAIAVLSAGLPAWRATRVDVSRNLREA